MLRAALVSLARTPAVTIGALVSLAVGIGVATTLSTAAHLFLLRPLAHPDAGRLVMVRQEATDASAGSGAPGPRVFSALVRQATTLALAAYHYEAATLTGEGPAERVGALRVGHTLAPVLGVHAARGRLFVADDMAPGAAPVVVLSDDFWRARFTGDPRIIGRRLQLDGRPHEVVGVLPRGFHYEGRDVLAWLPLSALATTAPDAPRLHVIGRLAPGVALAAAESEVASLAAALQYSQGTVHFRLGLMPLRDWFFDRELRDAGATLAVAGGLVLIVAGLNVACLLLVRAIRQSRDRALRLALGASPRRLIGDTLAEAALLAITAAAAGTLLASAGLRWLSSASSAPQFERLTWDGWALSWTLAAAGMATLISAIGPVLGTARLEPTRQFGEGVRTSRPRSPLLRLLVGVEVAAAVVVTASAGLLLASWASLRATDLGFDTNGVVTARVERSVTDEEAASRWHTLLDALPEATAQLPGRLDVGLTTHLPTRGFWRQLVHRPDELRGQTDLPGTAVKGVSAGYFRVLGIPLIDGRLPDDTDTAGSAPVALVNRALATRLWGNAAASGHALVVGDDTVRIIGIVGDTRDRGPANAVVPLVYRPLAQVDATSVSMVLASGVPAEALARPLRQLVSGLDRNQAVQEIASLDTVVAGWLRGERVMLQLLATLSIVTLLMAGVGVFGVLAHDVGRRTREFGIRLALGASPHRLLREVLAAGMVQLLTGVAAGIVAAVWATRLLAYFLSGVAPGDPAVLALVTMLVLAVGAAAMWLPAWRASRVDAAVVLRAE